MTTLADIRADLRAALSGVGGLTAYARVPGQVNVPAAVVAPDSVEFDADFDHGATYTLPVQILVQLGEWDTAQQSIDGFVAHDGSAVIAINDDTTVEARVTRMENYGLTSYAGVDYIGATLMVEVIV